MRHFFAYLKCLYLRLLSFFKNNSKMSGKEDVKNQYPQLIYKTKI